MYVVATPLGNLGDLTLRAREILAAADIIAAEDTRRSQRLLDAFGISTRLVAVHQHNEEEGAARIVGWLDEGRQVALISDAGTPGISDPGARVVARVRAAGHPVTPVPGPCAAIAALSVAGLVEGGFRFVGFLPPKAGARQAALAELGDEGDALVFYEAPHRVEACVADMVAVFGPERELLVARELTKLHEEIALMALGAAPAWFGANPDRLRGEFVLVVRGAPTTRELSAEAIRVLDLLLAELPLKSAVRLAAEITGAAKNLLYSFALERRAGE
ncbi:ribosomal RNA small subunit methyltransferase I [Betaproteobacteria bacterium]|nr:ribosomal RNA small subunit methyltransferase I [Betaproteobacteria bacterium]